ncbi:hypothetical protein ACFL6N_07780, partial [Thermodesulfobacteriota bacterium]
GQLSEKKVHLELTSAARSHLASEGHDPSFGARPLSRLIMREIGDKISDEILFGHLVKGGNVRIGIKNKQLTFSYTES